MEVFMGNLPRHLTDQGLKTQLVPFTKALNILDWSCQKPRKKTFGSITFLHARDGEQFLRHHEQEPTGRLNRAGQPQHKARLQILNTPVFCKPNTRALDPFLLKSLEKAAEDRQKAKQRTNQPQESKVAFTVTSLSCGYYDYSDQELVYIPEVEWRTVEGLAKFVKRAVIIQYQGDNGQMKIEIPNRTIEAMVVSTAPTAFTFTLWESPRFFRAEAPSIVELLAGLSFSQSASTATSRLTNLPGGNSDGREPLGLSLIYRVTVSPVNFHELTRRLQDRSQHTIYHHNFAAPISYVPRSLRDGLQEFRMAIREASRVIPSEVLYQVEALVANGYLLPWTVHGILMKMMRLGKDTAISSGKGARSKKFPISPGAVKQLFSQIPFPGLDVSASVFELNEIWQYIEDNEENVRKGLNEEYISERGRRNLTMVHKVNITPTGITFHGPEPEAKNRILRRFPNHTEFFIRAQFSDEDGTNLQFNSRVSNDKIYQRFKRVFNNGISICGRVYGFLGFSHSSLRSHSAWFMAPFVHEGKLHTYFTVIDYIGKFDQIFSPARCAARIGQAFSETPFAISLAANGIQHQTVSDVMSKDGLRVFSDGVGTISSQVAEAIHAGTPQRKGLLTCFQIRWGGAKGMLALDTRLEGNIINFRPSMIKFESTDNANLEICDVAKRPIPMVLNRQMIKILEDMGMPDKWFLEQQASALYRLQFITAHVLNTVEFLKRQEIADRIGLPQLIRQLHIIGIDYKCDRFLCSVVETAVLSELRLLKHKARIPINQGATLFGIMDETGYLDEGEIYVTFDNATFVHGHPMDLDNRQMIVTRSPALHPGDIQLATNVIPPDHHPLRALRNCIVFPRKGKRDLPSCLSGGDLDGDIYGIIWDSEAVNGCQYVFEPADYPRVEPLNIERPVMREDMTDFFIQFMATDQLGLIAVKHMILADQRATGTVDEDCKLLAEMHSTGVDYSKTGVPVDMTLLKQIKMSNKYRPDFLAPATPAYLKDRNEISFDDTPERVDEDDGDDETNTGPNHEYYRSEKISGKLYRAIDEQKIWYEDIKISTQNTDQVWVGLLDHLMAKCDELLGGVNWAPAKQQAWEIRHAYEDAISNATLEYSDHAAIRITELEVFTGNIFNKSGAQTRRQRDKSLQLKDEFNRIAQWAEGMIRKRSIAIPEDDDEEQELSSDNDGALALSIACLRVGQLMESRESRLRAGRTEGEFQSFKVVAACAAIRELDAAIKRAERVVGGISLSGN
ncbi:RNA dependent RNA polymerase-domain-containing protein [Lophiotrema nucula]|uniref:RNA-dependent RNA polymerase n=1 Tax=Lophiotrema nucula TaxID=690887 RepID=A0A6A5Z7Q5_9PLEO|nr:RNA dependent RNA polymerase-domain-containing protein [Lophiotrema nucula]